MRVTDKGSTSACQVVTAMDEWWGCTCQKLPLTNVNDVLMTQSARLAHARCLPLTPTHPTRESSVRSPTRSPTRPTTCPSLSRGSPPRLPRRPTSRESKCIPRAVFGTLSTTPTSHHSCE
ncbi:unnamed protein product [Zymoseptoria tritici ST99CH_3D7]|uniref:Uncharacterized protein n=1 Tax=Zymoseptoria tritici (strain ST99CH_3D7) TaxID=1276538 RepID=A0A1X7S706_ZYMT9|nr:unnamed protein product [Zymoseptoria tritici ST99CH_3D7]